MKKYIVPIFTEEYKVYVYIGTDEELRKSVSKYLNDPEPYERIGNFRGRCFSSLGLHPLIAVNGDLPANISIATLAHESVHALDYIADYIEMDDRSGEFMAHGVAAIMRTVLKDILRKK